jgi:hypothetical protein
MNRLMNRRRLLSATTAAALLPCLPALAGTLPEIVVNKDPYCGCCGAWIDHLRQAGFPATGVDVDDLPALKERLGVPAELASCHTAEVAGYVIEGHVPADAVKAARRAPGRHGPRRARYADRLPRHGGAGHGTRCLRGRPFRPLRHGHLRPLPRQRAARRVAGRAAAAKKAIETG